MVPGVARVARQRSHLMRGLAVGLAVGLLAGLGSRTEPMRRLELLTVDARMRLASPAEAPRIVVVGITQEDVQQERLGALPWPRRRYAQAIDKLSRAGARLIVLDLYFPRPSGDPDDDAALAQAVRRAGNVILPVYAKVDPREEHGRLAEGVRWLDLDPADYLERNVADLGAAALRQGHINLSAQDPDHLFRRVPAAIGFRCTGEVFYALSVEAAAASMGAAGGGRADQCAARAPASDTAAAAAVATGGMAAHPSEEAPDTSRRAETRPGRPDDGQQAKPADDDEQAKPVDDDEQAKPVTPRVSVGHLHIGDRAWPLDPAFPGCLPIDFSGVERKVDFHAAAAWRGLWGPGRSILLYSFSELMSEDFPTSAVADRIVYVGGLLYERHPDVHPTPAGQQPGVLLHALGTQTLLGGRYPHWLSMGAQAALTLGLMVFVAVGSFAGRFRWCLTFVGVALLGLLGTAAGLFEVAGLLIDTVSPAMGLGVVFLLAAANTLGRAGSALARRERELDTLVEMGRISASLVGPSLGAQSRILEAEDGDVLVPPLGAGVTGAAETVGATIRHVLGAEVAACYLVDPETHELAMVAASGTETDVLPEEMSGAGAAAARLALSDRRPILWLDGRRRPRHLDERVADLLCVPMDLGGRVAGAMVFFNKSATTVSPAHHFTADDVRLVTTLTRQAAVTLENARLYQSMHTLFLDAIRSLAAAIDAKDPYTRGHATRVAQLCGWLGRQMSLTAPELQFLHLAATLHDIGKIAIPEAVLNKPTSLTTEERRIIEKHPVRGAIILEPVRQLRPIIPGIRHHHERYDGTGYPDGLAGDAIPLLARVIAVADAYDAMTTDRPYRRALTETEALNEVGRNSGAQFDAELVDLFLAHFASVRALFVQQAAEAR